MSGQVRRLHRRRLSREFDPCPVTLFLSFSFLLLLFHFSAVAVHGEQTKEECQRCCEKQDLDEYYLEQCRVKCFRNPDHCIDRGASAKPAPPNGRPRNPGEKPGEAVFIGLIRSI